MKSSAIRDTVTQLKMKWRKFGGATFPVKYNA
jgi:hypothetical protein